MPKLDPTGMAPAAGPAAATLLRLSLDEHVARAQAADGDLRDPDLEWDSPPMYLWFRRLSTTLTVCRPLLDDGVEDLDSEVRWFLGDLRPLRELDRVRRRVAAAVPDDASRDSGSASLDQALAALRRDALARATRAWTSQRHADLYAALGRLYGTSVIRPEAEAPAAEVFRRVTADEVRRLRTRAEPPLTVSGAELEQRFHHLRGAARRVRCANSMLGQADAPTAARVRRRLKKLVKLLHEQRDSTLTRACLERLRDGGLVAPALADPVARLIRQEEAATARVAKKLPAAVTRAVSADRVLEGR
jgi:CHAD domain-containing protein